MAVEMAIDTVGIPSNADCFLIAGGEKGLTLFQTGACSEFPRENLPISDVFEEQDTGGGERVVWNGRKQLMMIERFSLGGEGALIACLGLNTDNLDRMIVKEKRWGMIAMGLMVFMAVLSMWLLYRNQNRSSGRDTADGAQAATGRAIVGHGSSGFGCGSRDPKSAECHQHGLPAPQTGQPGKAFHP